MIYKYVKYIIIGITFELLHNCREQVCVYNTLTKEAISRDRYKFILAYYLKIATVIGHADF